MLLRWLVPAAVAALLVSTPALTQQRFVYPAKGQSPQQQQKDEFDCHQWAIQQTGYDPANPRQQQSGGPPPSGSAEPEAGSGARGAVRGAVVGGLIGGIGGRGGEGAAAGAVVGGIAARRSSRREAEQRQQYEQQQYYQQQAAANAAGPEAYQRARAACLGGRGYTIN
jgi:hypothetical protein